MRPSTKALWISTLGIIVTISASFFLIGDKQIVRAISPENFLLSQNSDVIDLCFVLVVFDPNDSSVNLRSSPNGEVVKTLPNFTSVSMEVGPALIHPGPLFNYQNKRKAMFFLTFYIVRFTQF